MQKTNDLYFIFELLFDIYTKLKKKINNDLTNEGLSFSKVKILKFIYQNKINATDIKNYMQFSSRTIVTVLDSLEKIGLLYRKQSDKDRRIKYVCITKKGIEKLKIAEKKNENILNKSFSSLNKIQIENFYEICKNIDK